MSAHSFENKKTIPARFLSFHVAIGNMETALGSSSPLLYNFLPFCALIFLGSAVA
jgi:hypothetical protein